MFRTRLLPVFAAALSLTTGGCRNVATPSFSDDDRAAILHTFQDSLVLANSEKESWGPYVRSYYSADASFLPANAPAIQGYDEIIAMMQSFPPLSNIRMEIVRMEGFGEMAYVHGRYQMTLSMQTGPVVDEGKYVEIWKKQEDGSWRVVLDIFNSDLPLPDPVPLETR